ncbi:MAG: cation diffusion facilitator family transporter [Actinomycetota bacterium]|nr:cation diffusion facilitator family transporter [Actinomycetota bacterium]
MTREDRLRWTLVLNLLIAGGQVVFGLRANSLGLLADAGHNLTDVLAVALSFVAVRLVARSPTEERSFGYHRASILAAQANAASILAITVLIYFEAVRRLFHPEAVTGSIVVWVALIAAAFNGAAVLILREKNTDLNMRSALLHMGGDALASLGVAAAGGIILVTGRFFWLDPAVSIGIGTLIAWQAWRLLKAATEILMESTPPDMELTDLTRSMEGVRGVENVHDLHVWSLSSEVRALSAHVVLEGHPSLEEAQAVADRVKRSVSAPFHIAHATLELECENCVDDGSWCAMSDVSTPAATGVTPELGGSNPP